jgi:hypothetical protein
LFLFLLRLPLRFFGLLMIISIPERFARREIRISQSFAKGL